MYFLNGRDQLPNITRNAFSGLLLIVRLQQFQVWAKNEVRICKGKHELWSSLLSMSTSK